jgi:hypothetical protein
MEHEKAINLCLQSRKPFSSFLSDNPTLTELHIYIYKKKLGPTIDTN